jgi:hypothetical protein
MSFAAAECINWCAGSAHGLGILEKVLGHFVIRIKGTGRMAFLLKTNLFESRHPANAGIRCDSCFASKTKDIGSRLPRGWRQASAIRIRNIH